MDANNASVRRVARIRNGVVALGVGASLATGAVLGYTSLNQSAVSASSTTGSSSHAGQSTGISVGSGSTGTTHAKSSGS